MEDKTWLRISRMNRKLLVFHFTSRNCSLSYTAWQISEGYSDYTRIAGSNDVEIRHFNIPFQYFIESRHS